MTKYNPPYRHIRCPKCGHGFTPDSSSLGTLTKIQHAIYTFLCVYQDRHGYAPSFVEIAAAFDYNSLATVHEHLTSLERKGYIRRGYGEARAILILAGEDEQPASVILADAPVPMPGHDEHAEAAHADPRPVKGTEQALDHADGLHDLR